MTSDEKVRKKIAGASLRAVADVVESVTLKVSGMFVTASVGVPLICPVCAFSVSQAGGLRDVKAHV